MGNWFWLAAAALVLLYLLKPSAPAASRLTSAEVSRWIKDKKGLQLVDVRTPEEFATGHIPGAKLIPLSELDGRLGEMDPTKPLIVYCRSGHRSSTALKTLLSKGYKDAKDLQGGIMAWTGDGKNIIK